MRTPDRAQRGQVTYSMSYSLLVPDLGLQPWPPESLPGLYPQTIAFSIPGVPHEGWRTALRGPLISLVKSAK